MARVQRKQPIQQKTVQSKPQMPKPPEMSDKPGKSDKICTAIFIAGLVFTALVLFGSAYYISQTLVHTLNHTPIDWFTIVAMTIFTVMLGFILRGLVWLSFAGTTMLASHLQAWHAQTMISTSALKFRKFFPGGTSWAAQALMGQMANRQEFKELIAFGNSEYEATKSKGENLAPLCAYMGIAHQMQNDPHAAILWNERAIEYFQKAMAPIEKVNPTTKVPNRDFVDSMIMQYASSYANLAANYFAVSNYGKAKKNFNTALEQLAKIKDSQQKDMLVRGINEHLARLKHW